jgi:putative flippase GtrA
VIESTPVSQPKPKQPLVARLRFFALGGVGSAFTNFSILYAATHFLHWKYNAGYALSAGSTAVVFFFWSYFINFRTSLVWKNCIGRYIICFLLALLMNYLIGVTGLKHYGSSRPLQLLVIFIVQSFTGGIKFLLYHFWVFPYAEGPARKESPALVS